MQQAEYGVRSLAVVNKRVSGSCVTWWVGSISYTPDFF
jgi:hypothetical protein